MKNMIRDSKTHQITAAIETGARYGMQSLGSSIDQLVKAGLIDEVEANRYRSL